MDSLRRTPVRPRATTLSETSPEKPTVYSSPSPSASSHQMVASRPKSKRLFVIFSIAVFCLLSGTTLFVLSKGLFVGRNIQIENRERPSFLSDIRNLAASFVGKKHQTLRGEDDGRINILLLGRAGEHYPGRNLTDTVILMSIDTLHKKVALLSLPRDLYVPIHDTDLSAKLNGIYQYGLGQGYGISPLRASLEDITGQTIHYFFILDFDGFEKAVDALGGIPVNVARDFYDPRYPGKNYSYETFEIRKGWQILDGATALKYVRERHDDPEGDFGRAKRQQQVIQAIKDKAFSLGTFLNVFALSDLLDALGESVRTDMTLADMEGFLRLAKTLDTENTQSVVIDAWKKESLLRVSHMQVGPIAAFILVPRVGNWSEIRDVSEHIFRLDTLKERHERLQRENSSITLLYAPEDTVATQKMRRLIIEEMGFSANDIVSLGILENRPERGIIVDRSGLRKPFSLDELMKKFSLDKEASVPTDLPERDTSDLIIVVGENVAEALSFEETLATDLPSDDAFEEPLPPQPKKKGD